MSTSKDFQSFDQLFEKINFKKGREGRSVYSPAAYLSDLLQLMEDKFGEGNNFFSRRSDVKDIKLNGENAFTETAYLDIVNRILENKIKEKEGENAYEVLKKKKFPFNLPFDLEEEKFRQYLKYLEVDASTIYQLFSGDSDPRTVSKTYLNLSEEEFLMITNEPDDLGTFFKDHFNLDGNYFNLLSGIEYFLKRTDISFVELSELLFQNLSVNAKNTNNKNENEQSLAKDSFINAGTGGAAQLVGETSINWGTLNNDFDLNQDWFIRIQRSSRLIRLAKKIGVSITDLELALRTICGNQLNAAAIQKLAVLKQITERFDILFEESCALISDINNRGIGDGTEPMDLFNKTFNNRFTEYDPNFILGSEYVPEVYQNEEEEDEVKFGMMWAKGDLLSSDHSDYRKRIGKALNISEKDLIGVVQRFRAHFGEGNTSDNLLDVNVLDARESLSVWYRLSKLVEVLDTSYQELLDVFDVLAKDSSIRKFAQFSILINYDPSEIDCYKIIQGKAEADVDALLWLTQVLIGVMSWMQESDFTAAELKQILTGEPSTEKEKLILQEQKVNFLNALYQQVKPTFFGYENFGSDKFDERSARSIYRTVSDSAFRLVSKKDNRLVHFTKSNAQKAAEQAIQNLDIFSKEDFLGLGLEEKMVDKIFNNLMIKGYINAEGRLIEDAFPENVADFKINNSSVEEKKALFDTIQQMVKEEYEKNGINGNGGIVDISFSLSDLDELELPETRTMELYDNLIFNGYVDEEGNLVHPDFFVASENAEQFEPNANIDIYSEKVYKKIKAKIDCFYSEKLILKTDDFYNLPLHDIEVEDLIENLRFNEYFDQDNAVVNKKQLLELDANDMNIAIQFYPHRKAILQIIQDRINGFKAPYFTITKEMLVDVSEEIVAEKIYENFAENYLKDQQLTPVAKQFFADSENSTEFFLDPYFTNIHHQSIFKAIQGFITSFEKHQVEAGDLEVLGLKEEDANEILEILEENDFLQNGKLTPENRAYFLNINNALQFQIEDFSTQSKDIFFVFHAIAKEIEASVEDIYNNIETIAEEQRTALLSAIGEYAEMPADITEVILLHVFKNNNNLVEVLLIPILEKVNEKDRIVEAPSSNSFQTALRRLKQTALFVSKLRLTAEETEVVFNDQSLAEKFPEQLHLPTGMDRFDALLESGDNVYLFQGNQFWTYSRDGYELLETAQPLTLLSELFSSINQVDAAFTDANGNEWIIGRNAKGEEEASEGSFSTATYFYKNNTSTKWEVKNKIIGKVESNFDEIKKMDASFIDQEGKIYLFAGDQYMRYSSDMQADEGYPKSIQGNWKKELAFDLPEEFYESIDASFSNVEGVTYIFKDNEFISSEDYNNKITINNFWGRVKNNFDGAQEIDAAFIHAEGVCFTSGDQGIIYSDSIENEDVRGKEGSLKKLNELIPRLPDEFENGVDAVLDVANDTYFVFKDKQFATILKEVEPVIEGEDGEMLGQEINKPSPQAVETQWGIVKNNIALTGQVDAALAGLDGRTYLFSGTQFYRYSKADYSKVDEGYPLTISKYWSEVIHQVDAAFVLDGKTYLFGRDESQSRIYIRYSTNDYNIPDEGYPKAINDNWWNLPKELTDLGFDTPDAVFVGNDQKTYLFKNAKFISFDSQHRWWSEPANINQRFDSIPFQNITAAFTGKDGRTYIFENHRLVEAEMVAASGPLSISSGLRFVRYTDKNYNKIDDRYPKSISSFWGNVVNNIQKTKTVDAAITLESLIFDEAGEPINEQQKISYLFSGNQFYRYSENNFDVVDEGYPKTIATELKNEPRFANLDIELTEGIDAIFADRRNVYLFKNSECVVVSESDQKTYPGNPDAPIQGALMDEGSVYLFNENWLHGGALEGSAAFENQKMPSVLKGAPTAFQANVTVLNGTDQNTYIFNGTDCYNVSLEKHYPIGEEWGRTPNPFQINGEVDAAFVGRDGKTYLFSGDQFVSYTPEDGSTSFPSFVDGPPQSIAEKWGGLKNVQVAFVRDEKTYLLEAANAAGEFRYVCYSSEDYSQPDLAEPQHGDITWWDMPEDYIEEGFDYVNTVLFEEDNMFLLNEDSFVQYNSTEEIWTFPKPLQRIWRNLPEDNIQFEGVKTAFTGTDGITRFFSKNTFVEYHNLPDGAGNNSILEIKKIESLWGIEDNNMVRNNQIDAAVVINNKMTFLFSGDQYVRYSGMEYRFVDEGYPKVIVGNLSNELGFEKISEELEIAIASDQNPISILANQHNLYIFEGSSLHVFSDHLVRKYDIDRIGKLKNNIATNNQVDAAYVNQWDETYLFSGDQFFKYSTTDYEFVDQGFPKSIAKNLAKEEGFEFLPQDFDNQVDAIFKLPNSSTFLFAGKAFYDSNAIGDPDMIIDIWGQVNNEFTDDGEDHPTPIDAAFVAPDGKAYFFKNNQYVRYSDLNNEFVDEGFPKRIKDNWGNLFPGTRRIFIGTRDFEARIDGAFVFEGNTYFAKGDEYVRFSNSIFTKMDSIYPQPFRAGWTDRNDFLLNDLKIMSRYKELQEQYQSGDETLTDFFYEGKGYQKEPFQMLANIFDWNVEEVKWLKQRNVFLQSENEVEVKFDLEQVLKMYDVFAVSNKMGILPSDLYKKVWLEKFENHNAATAAATLYAQLGLNNSEADWRILARQMHDEMNLMRRDALVPYLIEIIKDIGAEMIIEFDSDTFEERVIIKNKITDARDLFEYLLIDVEMGSDAKTSNIKEATAAVQLYFHRYFVNLEERNDADVRKKAELKEWWKWMKNYRVWEANRKVFLYPENYIRPELRDTKTPEFQQLEDSLLQGVIDQASVEKSLKQYIDNFATVGNLKIAGANVYTIEDGDNNVANNEDVLLLFGHTRTEPAEYYFRTARFKGSAEEWTAWKKTELPINSSRVFPVYANGRLLVFWVEIEEYEDSKGSLNRRDSKSEYLEVNTSNSSIKHRAHVKYAFYDHNERWSAPQKLKSNIDLNYGLDAAYIEVNAAGEREIRTFAGSICLSSTLNNPSGDAKFIEEYPEYENLPPAFKTGIDAVTTFNNRRYYFKHNQCVVQDLTKSTVNGKEVYAFRTYPTSQLLQQPPGANPEIFVFNVSSLGLGEGKPISFPTVTVGETPRVQLPEVFDAAFTIEDKILCLIDEGGKYTFYKSVNGGDLIAPIQSLQSIKQEFDLGVFNFEFFMSTIGNKGGQFAPADGVYKEDGDYFVLRNGLYESYEIDGNGLLKAKDGFPKPIKGNLSINMDKFFNRLHVVWHKDDLGGYVSIAYRTAKDELLLSGKLEADFTFEEMSFRDTFSEDLILAWKRSLSRQIGNDFNPTLIDNTITEFNNFKSNNIASQKSRTDKLAKIKTGLNELTEAVGMVELEDIESAKTKISSAIKSLRVIKNADVKNFKDIQALVPELQTAITDFENAEEDDQAAALATAKTKAGTIMEHIREKSSQTLKTQIETLVSDIQASFDSFLRSSSIVTTYLTQNRFEQGFRNWIFITNQLEVQLKLPDDSEDTLDEQELLADHKSEIQNIDTQYQNVRTNLLQALSTNTGTKTGLNTLSSELKKTSDAILLMNTSLGNLEGHAQKIQIIKNESFQDLMKALDAEEERVFGRFDLFHKKTNFGITNTRSNFSFGFVDWYIFEIEKGTFLCRPLDGKEEGEYSIIRLTTNTIPQLSSRLFAQGIDGLISLKTQQVDELPGFVGATGGTIEFSDTQIKKIPTTENLDFLGANSNYFWEIFFHAPFLIAQALNTEQRFEEAKKWYEYIFDPTQNESVWRFLPFSKKEIENRFISDPNQLQKYYNDPFDPHAIAGLRINAYRKSIVMNYIDNLLDWGDMLFRQYTMESINEARMLYILAYDLLGKKPESTGNRILSADQTYEGQKIVDSIDLDIWDLENEDDTSEENQTPRVLTVHSSNLSSYFFIPDNDLFLEYWDRVEDRLYKIRQSLNIKGIKQPLPLFQPPIDPMALVLAASSGAGLSSALGSMNVPVPHYRFSFMINKAKELVDKLNQFGGELLSALEKKDAEELSIMQSRQEGIILAMSKGIRQGQLMEAENQLKALNQSLSDANWRLNYHENTIAQGPLPTELLQMGLMGASIGMHGIAAAFNLLGLFGYLLPEATLGPFSVGVTVGGDNAGDSFSQASEASSSISEALSISGELAGMTAQQMRMREDWVFQKATTEHEITQIEMEIQGVEIQAKMAALEIDIYKKEVEHQESVEHFYRDKFSNQQLYQWMSSRLSGMYFQTYKLAFDMAKYAEKAFQYERGVRASEVNFIQPNYWNSQRKGLLAGETLGLDLDRMEQAFLETNERRLEISKNISLIELDPIAFLNLLKKGACDFRLTEALFDYDFQGHYCRQIKTITLTISAGEGQTVNATLTQLNHRTVMEPDAKAVKFLLNPKDKQPLSIRSDWRANQQIAISHVGEYDDSNGMFELRFDDERYLPFEGTGAVSTWRLELNGKKGSYNISEIKDVVMNVKYTALQGGENFANAVKGLLKPYLTARMIDLSNEFSEEWAEFMDGDSNDLVLTLTRDHFPNMGSNKITGAFAKFETTGNGAAQMILNNDDAMTLKDGKFVETTGLSISNRGTQFTFTLKGRKDDLENVKVVLGYKAVV